MRGSAKEKLQRAVESRPMLETDVASAARRCPRFFMARLGFPNTTRMIAADSRRKR